MIQATAPTELFCRDVTVWRLYRLAAGQKAIELSCRCVLISSHLAIFDSQIAKIESLEIAFGL